MKWAHGILTFFRSHRTLRGGILSICFTTSFVLAYSQGIIYFAQLNQANCQHIDQNSKNMEWVVGASVTFEFSDCIMLAFWLCVLKMNGLCKRNIARDVKRVYSETHMHMICPPPSCRAERNAFIIACLRGCKGYTFSTVLDPKTALQSRIQNWLLIYHHEERKLLGKAVHSFSASQT